MARRDRSISKRFAPSAEGLEDRCLLSVGSTTAANNQARVARVRHEQKVFIGDLQNLEWRSHATQEEFLALRDDARAIGQAASSTTLPPAVAATKAAAASLELDRSTIDGFLDDSQWAAVQSRLEGNLDGLNVPQSLIDQTIADMKAIADSAGVTGAEYDKFEHDSDTFRQGNASLPSGYAHFDDPGLYFSQHLRGFVHGQKETRQAAIRSLNADLRAIAASPSDLETLRRDAGSLQTIEAGLTSDQVDSVEAALTTALADPSPSPAEIASLGATLDAIYGPGVSPTVSTASNRLLNDFANFAAALGGSADHVATVLNDVRAVVDAGGSVATNPFRITISRTGAATS